MKIVTYTDITAYPLLGRGKVRDIYELDERTLLIITTDRMSAFDVVLNEPVPYKGVVLNRLTLFWAQKLESVVPNAVISADLNDYPDKLSPWLDELEGRSMLVRKAHPLPIECIVRGYIAGSGWESYKRNQEICGQKLPAGLKQAGQLEPPLYTPTTKAAAGSHDENITYLQTAALIGDEAARQAKMISLELYETGRAHAAEKGIIIADTKFELGFIDNRLHVIDEILTPDSSRFWPASTYSPGHSQPSYDKQYLRDWLTSQNWNHQPPPPEVPQAVITATSDRYLEAYATITGSALNIQD